MTREQAAGLGQGRKIGGGHGERWTDLKEFTKNTEQTDRFDEESQ